MDLLAAVKVRDDLHPPQSVVTPGADLDRMAIPGAAREERGMPTEETILGERLVELLRGVEYECGDRLRPAIEFARTGVRHAESTRERRADSLPIQHLPFDLAGRQGLVGQRAQRGLARHVEAERRHLPSKPALAMTQCAKASSEARRPPSGSSANRGDRRCKAIFSA